MNRLTQEEFIQRSQKTHGDKYDYSLVNYINSDTKVKIICSKHGVFEQIPNNHIRGNKCFKCGRRMNSEDFIKKAQKIHKNKYDYSLVDYELTKNKIKIICPEHGIFIQTPNTHLYSGCSECSKNKKLTIEYFINKSNEIHNNYYNYSLITEIINNNTKVKIICSKHGVFEQTPNSHFSGSGCPICRGNTDTKINNKLLIFLTNCKKIHGNKYNYKLVNYINSYTKVKIICSIHGIFEQTPNNHLGKIGCQKCYGLNKTTDEFIKESNIIHDNFYNYSLTEYKKSMKKVKIICPKHGIFEQTPNRHLSKCGCPKCRESCGEKEIRKYLIKKSINFEYQKRFPDCRNKIPLPFDFYLPDYNLCIEYNGSQHYMSCEHFGGEKSLKYIQTNDNIKINFCKNNNINLLIIKFNENIESILNQYIVIKQPK